MRFRTFSPLPRFLLVALSDLLRSIGTGADDGYRDRAAAYTRQPSLDFGNPNVTTLHQSRRSS